MKDALRIIPFTGAFGSITVFHKIIDERSVQRSGRQDVQSAIRSLRRNHGFYNPTTQEEIRETV